MFGTYSFKRVGRNLQEECDGVASHGLSLLKPARLGVDAFELGHADRLPITGALAASRVWFTFFRSPPSSTHIFFQYPEDGSRRSAQMLWTSQTLSATSRSLAAACGELDFSPHDATIALFTDEKVGCISPPKSQCGRHRKEGRYEADEEVSGQLRVEVCWKCG
jgi:hypothetical protein